MNRHPSFSHTSNQCLFPITMGLICSLLIMFFSGHTTSAAISRESGTQGCLRCHRGISVINHKMQPYLLTRARAIYNRGRGFECAVCHGGNPEARDKRQAHENMASNPSSLWVLHQGRGCAQCHDGHHSITSLMGTPMRSPTGGEIMSCISKFSDPTGHTGMDYTYRLSRSLMALETGKANKTLSSNGIIPKGTFPFADFSMDDPDGAEPVAGSAYYRQWIGKALNTGFIKRLERVKEIPDFSQATTLFKSEEKAGFADIHRKQCARCHVWGEGRDRRGDRRASGCAACHVLYDNDGLYKGNDPCIRENSQRFHPMRHRITTAIPSAQCTHCHTRGKRIGTTFTGMFEYDYVKDGRAPPFDKKARPQRPLFTKEYMYVNPDVHFKRGIQCIDCHTSIDVHGDGNIYPVTWYQVEISCYDCHGTPEAYPWELPVGFGSPVSLGKPRGTFSHEGTEYLLTSRGNVKRNWIRKGNSAVIRGMFSGKEHQIPLLKNINKNNRFRSPSAKTAMTSIPHLKHLECYACHAVWAPQCFGCHIKYDRRKPGTDWVITSKTLQTAGRQTITTTPGNIALENRSFLRWEDPVLGVNFRGRVSPLVPGCQVFYTFIDSKGRIKELNRHYATSTGQPSPTMAPVQPHSISPVARTCENCHTSPKAVGYGTGNSRYARRVIGDSPLFSDMSKGIYGDIPGDNAPWQVPPIKDFPFSLEQLVTRRGIQVQNMPLPADRPLDSRERQLTEREGLCTACHQFAGTDTWQQVISKYGRANTPEEHDRIMEKALKALVQP